MRAKVVNWHLKKSTWGRVCYGVFYFTILFFKAHGCSTTIRILKKKDDVIKVIHNFKNNKILSIYPFLLGPIGFHLHRKSSNNRPITFEAKYIRRALRSDPSFERRRTVVRQQRSRRSERSEHVYSWTKLRHDTWDSHIQRFTFKWDTSQKKNKPVLQSI